MAKIYLVLKRTFADFDIPIEPPVLAHEDSKLIDLKVEDLNAKRSKKDLDEEIKYRRSWVKLLR